MVAPPTTKADVLIVGAGPVGMILALLLAARGHSSFIFERWDAPFPLPRAIGMSHDSVRTLYAAGVLDKLDGVLEIKWRDVVGHFIDADGETLFASTYPGSSESGYPTMATFNQPDLEAVLERCCRDDPLISLLRGCELEGLTQHGDHVVVQMTRFADGRREEGSTFTALGSFLVGCDGANSRVRDLMASEMVDTGFVSNWLVVDIIPTDGRVWEPELVQSVDPARPTTMLPSGRGRRRFEFMALAGEAPEKLASTEVVWSLLAKFDVRPENAILVRSAYYTFRGRWAADWRDGNVLLAGDSAHQMPPFLGQGLNSGVRDAAGLAWRLARVLDATSPADILDSYSSERIGNVRQVIESSVEAGKTICITDPLTAKLRDAELLRRRGAAGSPPPSKLRPWRLGPGLLRPDDPLAGFLGVQGRVRASGRTAFFDEIVGTGKFVLLGDGLRIKVTMSEAARCVWNAIDGVIVEIGKDVEDVDNTYAQWFETMRASIVLIRPDYQIYGAIADVVELDGMILKLGEQLGLSDRLAEGNGAET